ncbi:MAG: sigma-54 dependent transcriptional regulator [Gemmatimonadota bacterium]|nr:MAG: sigma-54 dependent transcriptional regulator [Gemmatimonadota bacterium]
MRARIAVCDDEMLIRLWLEEHLGDAGYEVETFEKAGELLVALENDPVDLALLDLRLPDGSGIDFLPRIKKIDAEIPVIMMTAYGDVETAVRAVRAGAHHFLEKPIELAELLLLIEKALETTRLMSEVDRYRDGTRWQFSDVILIGRSFAMRRVAETITRLALRGSPATVLVQGETGTGKDLVARAIHARGPRQDKPFIAVNCTALPESLVESELFGHQAGAFTDAREEKRGLFELAHGGTLLLDEVGDMPKAAQAKLLSVLETHVLRRVGGLRDIPIDVHVIAATNRDLEALVGAGEFREDLFYRLSVVSVHVPPLRERREDIAPLALHFLASLCLEMGLPTRRLSPDALRSMEAYDWPGNGRQLRNLLERILLLDDRETVELASLPPEFRVAAGIAGDAGHSFVLPPDGVDLETVERDLILQALERTGGNKTRSARLLGLSRDTFRYRVEKHGL